MRTTSQQEDGTRAVKTVSLRDTKIKLMELLGVHHDCYELTIETESNGPIYVTERRVVASADSAAEVYQNETVQE